MKNGLEIYQSGDFNQQTQIFLQVGLILVISCPITGFFEMLVLVA